MAEEIAVLLATLKLDVSQMRREFASLQGQLVAGMGGITSSLEALGTKGFAKATASATQMTSIIQTGNAKALEQLGILEAQTVAQNANNIKKVALFNATRIANQSLQNDLEKAAVASQQKILASIEADLASQKAIATKKAQLALDTNDKIAQADIKSKSADDYRRNQATKAAITAQERVSANYWNAQIKQEAAAENTHNRTLARISRTVAAIAAVMIGRAILGGFENLIKTGLEFNATLETAKLGIGSILMAHGEFVDSIGQAKVGYDKLVASQQLSGEIVKQLQKDNLQTAATLEQLVAAYQQTLGPALAKGFNTDQVEKFTVAMVQAAGAIGLSLNQIAEETRSLLEGTITPRNTRIATALGITNEDIRQMQGNAGALFTFLMSKLESFKIAGIASQTTWTGLISNVTDMFKQALGAGFEPLFNYAKEQLIQLQNYLVKIDINGNFTINPEVLNAFKSIGSFVIGFIEMFKALTPIIKLAFTPIILATDLLGKLWQLGAKIINVFTISSDSAQLNKNIANLKEKIASDFRTPEIEIPVAIKIDPKKLEEAKRTLELKATPGLFVDLSPAITGRGKGQMFEGMARGRTQEQIIQETYEKWRNKELSIVITADTSKFKAALEDLTEAQKSEINNLSAEVNDYWTFVDNKVKYVGAIQIRNLLLQIDSQKTLNELLPEQMASLLKIAEARDKAKTDTAKELLDKKAIKQMILEQYHYEKQIAAFKGQVVSGQISYAESIGDTNTINKLLQEQVNIKNELIQKESWGFLILHPEAQKYIDELKEQNQLTANQQILLNNLSKQSAVTDAAKQVAELSYNWEDLAIFEQQALDIEIKGQRIKFAGNQELLNQYEQIYQLKSRNLTLDVREKELATKAPVAQAAESLYSTSGNSALLSYIQDYNQKVIALTKERNAIIYENEKEAAMMLLALEQNKNDALYSLALQRNNKQYEAYSKLYKATGKQEYYDRLIQIENQILDNEDYFNNQIVDTEQASYDLRMIRMQEFQNSRLDMIQNNANQEIGIAKQTTNALLSEQQRMSSYWSTLNWGGTGSVEGFMASTGSSSGRYTVTTFVGFPSKVNPFMRFWTQGEADEYDSNFSRIEQYGGLSKVVGPAASGGEQWFKSIEDARTYLNDWKNGLGQATTSISNLSSAVDTLTSKFQSAYQSYQSFITERERKNWGGMEWTNEFDRLVAVFNSNPGIEKQIDTLSLMLDAIKKLDDIQQQALQVQKQLASDFLSGSQSIDDFINSLNFGQLAPYQSYGAMTTEYTRLKGLAGTLEGAQKFTDFTQSTFLPFLKNYGETGYNAWFEQIITDMEQASDVLKGKSVLIGLGEILGIDLSNKWEIKKEQVFNPISWTTEEIAMFKTPDSTGISLFEKIMDWGPEQLALWGNIFTVESDPSTWTPNTIKFWTDIINMDNFDGSKWTPVTIKFWTDIIDKSKDAKWMKPETVDFWTDVVSKININDWKNPETVDFWTNVVKIVNPDYWKKPQDIDFWTNVIKLGTWKPETVDFWTNVIDKSKDTKWMKPETIFFWTNVIDKSKDTKWMTPEPIDFWTNVVQIVNPLKWKSPQDIDFWTNVVKLGTWTAQTINLWDQITDQSTAFKTGTWTPKPIDINDIATITGQLAIDIAAGNLPGVTEGIQALIDKLGSSVNAGTLAKAAIDSADAANTATDKVNLLSLGVNNTETPFNSMSEGVATMVSNVKTQLKTVGELFDALANQMGINFGATGLVAAVQKINTQTITTTTYREPAMIGWSKLTDNWWPALNLYGILVPGQNYIQLWSAQRPDPVPYYPKAAEGTLTSGLTIAGEIGPEYIVPTYEPQHSDFLKTMGVDTNKISDMMVTKQSNIMNNFLDKLQMPSTNNYEIPKSTSTQTIINIDSTEIGKEIAKQLTGILMTSNSNQKESHTHIYLGTKEIADIVAGEIYNGHSGLVKNIRRVVK